MTMRGARRDTRPGVRALAPAIASVPIVLAACLAPLGCVSAKPGAHDASSARTASRPAAADRARRAVETLRELAGIPGISVAVGDDRTVLWAEGFGYADRERGVPVTADTRFRIASISKVLTAAAVAKLVQEGRLDLDAPINRYVPSWPDHGYTITARQLAGHLGGIRGYRSEDFTVKEIEQKRYGSSLEALGIFEDDPLVSPPGTRFVYSTFGFTLLGAVVEGASKRPFLDTMREEVLGPLELADTVPNLPDAPVPRLTTLYAPGQNGNAVAIPNAAPSYKWPGGGYVSTASDLVRFGQAHLHPGFLEKETLDLLFTSQRTLAGRETNVGIAWCLARDPWGRRVYFHNGSQAGARTVLMLYPDDDVVVAVLSNLSNTPPLVESVAMGVAEPFLEARGGGESSTSREAAAAGLYRYTTEVRGKASDGTVSLFEEDGDLRGWMTASPGARAERLPITTFEIRGREADAVVAAPEGLLLLRMRVVGNGFSGTLHLDDGMRTVRLPIEMTRQERPHARRSGQG